MGEKRTQESIRLYLFPGGYHCAGGEGPMNADLLSAIMDWVENGKDPEKLIVSPYQTRGKQDQPAWEGSTFFKPYRFTDGKE
jgi:feruloyl esterase